MKKKLIATVVVLSVILAMSVALLIYLELTHGEALPVDTKPSSFVDTNIEQTTTSAEEQTVDTEPSSPTDSDVEQTTTAGGEFIIGPDDIESDNTDSEQSTNSTEYAPPEGRDEDETPIL